MTLSGALLTFLLAVPPAEAYELPPSSGTHRVRFDAEEANFNEITRVIDLKGGVKLEELSSDDKILKLIRARELSVNMASRTLTSPSDFVIDDDTGTIFGKSGTISYADNTGFINDARFSHHNFIFRGRKVTFDPDRYVYRKASVTSCEEDPPHYRLRASRIYLAPGRYFLAYNTALFVGPFPVFYFPVIYRPVGGGTPFVSSFYPGYDERNGTYLKSNFAYRVNRETRAKVYLDYFGKRGLGTGGELDYRLPEKNISNISAYRIREYGQSAERWGLNGGFWHSFNRFNESDPAQYYGQAYFRLISDPAFNNDFFRTNPFAISQDKQASLALTRQSNYTVMRLSAYGRDTRSPSDPLRFVREEEAAPRLELNTVPFKVLGVPVLNSFAGHLESGKLAGVPYYQKRGRGAWTVTKTVPFSKNVILSPSVFYDQSVAFSTASALEDAWTGRYGGAFNLRYDRLWGSMDLRYAHTTRTRVNSLSPDLGSPDRGQETRSLYGDLFIMPGHNRYFRARTSYDLRDSIRARFNERLSPLITEAYYAPRPELELYLQDSYSFNGTGSSFIAQLNAGGSESYFGAGVANYSSDPEAWVVGNTFGFKPWKTSKWRAEAVLRYRAVVSGSRLDEFLFFEKGLTLYRDFHDFRTRWDFRERVGGVKEFFFFVTLKMNDPDRRDDLEEKSRRFWRPWRQEGAQRDY